MAQDEGVMAQQHTQTRKTVRDGCLELRKIAMDLFGVHPGSVISEQYSPLSERGEALLPAFTRMNKTMQQLSNVVQLAYTAMTTQGREAELYGTCITLQRDHHMVHSALSEVERGVQTVQQQLFRYREMGGALHMRVVRTLRQLDALFEPLQTEFQFDFLVSVLMRGQATVMLGSHNESWCFALSFNLIAEGPKDVDLCYMVDSQQIALPSASDDVTRLLSEGQLEKFAAKVRALLESDALLTKHPEQKLPELRGRVADVFGAIAASRNLEWCELMEGPCLWLSGPERRSLVYQGPREFISQSAVSEVQLGVLIEVEPPLYLQPSVACSLPVVYAGHGGPQEVTDVSNSDLLRVSHLVFPISSFPEAIVNVVQTFSAL